ncbi:hypothetical protein VCUG_02371 [Vavraia culicis subsp. floridensis]|uniref:Secreted protein n=1 Tax=Vavraia culicis (isolate floridensis) TaxID=948595 RepID=L2GR54_VAVCU|nr:uncharacterized protein VCUG_02371 [Vavraia culicis subsp. floridensis]ELA46136.1 hypothetical protein VCUG_02371 [Vavraia culicis subsp. floridensis]
MCALPTTVLFWSGAQMFMTMHGCAVLARYVCSAHHSTVLVWCTDVHDHARLCCSGPVCVPCPPQYCSGPVNLSIRFSPVSAPSYHRVLSKMKRNVSEQINKYRYDNTEGCYRYYSLRS